MPGEIKRCFAQGLGRDCAGVHRYPANPSATFDHQYPLAELGRIVLGARIHGEQAGVDAPREELQKSFEDAYWRRFEVELNEIRAVLVNLHTAVIGKRRYLERYIWPEMGIRPIVVLATHREGRSQVALFGNAAAVARWQFLHPEGEPEVVRQDDGG